VNVWDAVTGQELLSLKEQSGFTLLTLSPDGKRIATADGTESSPRIRVWDAQTGQVIFTFQGHASRIDSMAFSVDSKRLASGSRDQTIRIWDLQTGEGIRTLRGHPPSILAFSPDGTRVASVGQVSSGGEKVGGEVKVWDAQKAPETLTLKGINRQVAGSVGDPCVVFSQDLSRVAGISYKTVKVWDARNGQETLTLKGHTDNVYCVAFSSDGKYMASGDSGRRNAVHSPGVVKVWDAQTGQELHTLKGHITSVRSVAFSPNGKRLASASEDRTVKVWDTQTGQELFSPTLTEPQFKIYVPPSVAFSPDGKRLAGLAGGAAGGGLSVWDAQTGNQIMALQGSNVPLAPLVFSPDGKHLAGVSWERVKVWDAQTGQELLLLKGGHTNWVSSVAFSPDGKCLASASNDMVRLWDLQTGQETLSLKAHTKLGGSLAFSPDGHRLGSVSIYGAVTFWDATPLPEKP
jgi:WD40 repeat protein